MRGPRKDCFLKGMKVGRGRRRLTMLLTCTPSYGTWWLRPLAGVQTGAEAATTRLRQSALCLGAGAAPPIPP